MFCLHRKEEKLSLLFLQHKEFIPINKEASYIHLFTLPEHSKVMIWPPSNMAKSQLFQGLGEGLNS